MSVLQCFSERGKPLLLFENAKFSFKKTLKSGEKFWTCTSKKCTAKIFTVGERNVISRSVLNHNHTVDIKKINRHVISNSIKRIAAENLSEKPSKILHLAFRQNTEFTSTITAEDVKYIRNNIYWHKRKNQQRLAKSLSETITDLSETDISMEGAIQETEQSADVIKEEIDDDIFAESQDELLLTKEEILTLVSETNNEKVAAADLVKEEPDSEDENEPAIKRSRVEYSQLSTDLDQPGPSHELNQPSPSHDFDRPSPNHDFDQPGPSRLATTDELQTPLASSNDVTPMSNDVALDNLLNYSGDLNMFFKTILSVAQKLDPVDQVILQRNITNAVFDIKIKEMTNKKS